jgi:DNA-binding NtrC family response regulator
MIEIFKRRLWRLLSEKDVSLAMVYDREGRILWHCGRSVRGSSIRDGEGFSKTLALTSLEGDGVVTQEEVLATSAGEVLPRSARMLFVKSLLIRPIGDDLFLYADSGTRDRFDAADREVIGTIGELLAEALADIRTLDGPTGGLSGTSAAVQAVRQRVARYAVEDEPVLLTGETGVGKNRVAELVHRASGRKGPFVPAHMPSIPDGLIESELFGHRKGAFTGAVDDRRGLIEEAEGGLLFLDEVGEIPPAFQAKLLRVVETRRYRVVGDPREREADVRIVAATNRDLHQEVQAKRFRQDLFYRLSVLTLRIPPLRERPEDVRALVLEHERRLRGKSLGAEAWRVLLGHGWPGNVRELIHVLTRAGVEPEGATIGAEIEELLGPPSPSVAAEAGPDGPLQQALRDLDDGQSFWDTLWQAFLDRDVSRRDMRVVLSGRFTACERSLKRLAADLNIDEADYPRFVSTLHKYEIHPGR